MLKITMCSGYQMKIKFHVLWLLAVLNLNVFIIHELGFADVTEVLFCNEKRPGLSIEVKRGQGKVRLQWSIPLIQEHLPLTDSIVDGSQMPLLKFQMRDLANFPSQGQVQWDLDQCSGDELQDMSCESTVNGQISSQIQVGSFKIWQNILKHQKTQFESFTFQLNAQTANNTYFLPFKFLKQQCRFSTFKPTESQTL